MVAPPRRLARRGGCRLPTPTPPAPSAWRCRRGTGASWRTWWTVGGRCTRCRTAQLTTAAWWACVRQMTPSVPAARGVRRSCRFSPVSPPHGPPYSAGSGRGRKSSASRPACTFSQAARAPQQRGSRWSRNSATAPRAQASAVTQATRSSTDLPTPQRVAERRYTTRRAAWPPASGRMLVTVGRRTIQYRSSPMRANGSPHGWRKGCAA